MKIGRGIIQSVQKSQRWAFNIATLVSLIFSAASAGMWGRSYLLDESWVFRITAKTRVNDHGRLQETHVERWLESSKGELIWVEWESDGPYTSLDLSPGYSSDHHAFWMRKPPNRARLSLDKSWDAPGVIYDVIPFAFYSKTRDGKQLANPGIRSLQISWWTILTASCVLPVVWGTRRTAQFMRARRNRLSGRDVPNADASQKQKL